MCLRGVQACLPVCVDLLTEVTEVEEDRQTIPLERWLTMINLLPRPVSDHVCLPPELRPFEADTDRPGRVMEGLDPVMNSPLGEFLCLTLVCQT